MKHIALIIASLVALPLTAEAYTRPIPDRVVVLPKPDNSWRGRIMFPTGEVERKNGHWVSKGEGKGGHGKSSSPKGK